MLMRTNGSLTQRGRQLRTLVGVAALAAALLLAPRAFADEPVSAGSLGYDTYTVASGETLWTIADGLTAVEGDVAATVRAIMELNEMDSATVAAGEQIVVPLG